MLRASAAAACALLAAGPLPAQVSVRFGGVHARYAGGDAAGAATIAPRVDWAAGAARGGLEASVAQFLTGGWAVQGTGDLSASRPIGAGFALALVASANGSWLGGGTWSAQAMTGLGLGHSIGPLTATVGASGGLVRSIADTSRGLTAVIGALGVRTAGLEAAAHAQRATMGAARWTDLDLGLAYRAGALSVAAGGGTRRFDGAGQDAAWRVLSSLVLRPGVSLEVAAGSYPRSPDGFTDGRYVTAGIRLASVARPGDAIAIERAPGGRSNVRFAIPGARSAAIAGDWNDWTPAPMTREGDGRWLAELPFAAGAHHFVLVVDGERRVPHGVPRLPDGFGGTVGLLVL